MLYERLKSRDDLTAIETCLCLLVHAQRTRQRFAEMEVIALAGRTEENAEALQGALERYRELLIPGSEKPKDDWVEQAKALLVEEVKKVYLVRPKVGMTKLRDLQKAATSSNPAFRSWASEELKKEANAQERLKMRVARKGRQLPPGTVKHS